MTLSLGVSLGYWGIPARAAEPGVRPQIADDLAVQRAVEGTSTDSPLPESGSVSDAVYRNRYFGLTLPLPPGWSEGLAGPPPSRLGYYVLTRFESPKAENVSVLVGAQDLFFSVKGFENAQDMTADFEQGILKVPNMVIDREQGAVTIAGQKFQRVDYSAGGLYRTWLAAELRCHVLIFNITGTDRASTEKAVRALDAMSLPSRKGTEPVEDAAPAIPVCIKGYSSPETLLHVVTVPQIAPAGLKLPVRLIIGTDGRVRQVHVIGADEGQSDTLTPTLMKWVFKPHTVDGRPVEVETGLVVGGPGN